MVKVRGRCLLPILFPHSWKIFLKSKGLRKAILIKMFTLSKACCNGHLLLERHCVNSKFSSTKENIFNHISIIEATQHRINLSDFNSHAILLKNMHLELRI